MASSSFFDLSTDELCHWLLAQEMHASVRPELEKLADLWRGEGVSGSSFPPDGLEDAEWREMVPRMAIRLPLKRLMDAAMKSGVKTATPEPKVEPEAKQVQAKRGRGGFRPRKTQTNNPPPPAVEEEPSAEPEDEEEDDPGYGDEGKAATADSNNRSSPRLGPGRGGRRKPGPKPRKKEPRVSLEGVREEDMLDVSKVLPKRERIDLLLRVLAANPKEQLSVPQILERLREVGLKSMFNAYAGDLTQLSCVTATPREHEPRAEGEGPRGKGPVYLFQWRGGEVKFKSDALSRSAERRYPRDEVLAARAREIINKTYKPLP